MSLALGDEEGRRARARAQLLGGSSPALRDPAAVAATLVGVQAQDQLAAALSIRARTGGLVVDDIEREATDPEAHSLILTWSLRGTRHFHHPSDIRWLLGLLGPLFARPRARAEQLGIAGRVGDQAVQVLADALASGITPTRSQVGELLAGYGVDPTTRAPIHIIRRAALEGILCIVPDPGGDQRQERYVSLDAWLPVPHRGGDKGAPELVRRYLAAYGPATAADFAVWSGLGAAAVAAAWHAVKPQLVELRLPGGTAWMVDPPQSYEPFPPRLLGGFDALIVGYADRSLHLDAGQARSVNAGGGLIKPVVVVDGRVVATWKLCRSPVRARSGVEAGARVELSPLPGEAADTDLRSEIDDVRRFLRLSWCELSSA